MGVRVVDLVVWIKFLKSQGLIIIAKTKGRGGHDKWNVPDESLSRPITFPSHQKQLSQRIIKSCLKTLCITDEEFMEIIDSKKMVHVDEIRAETNPIPQFQIKYSNQNTPIATTIITAYNSDQASKEFYEQTNYQFYIIEIERLEEST